VEFVASALRDEEGRPTLVLGVSRDITDRKRIQLERKNQAHAQEQLLNAAPGLVLLLKPDGTLVSINKAAAKRLGGTPDELVGSKTLDLLPLEVRASRKAHFAEAIRTKKPVSFSDVSRGRHFDNTFVPLLRPMPRAAMTLRLSGLIPQDTNLLLIMNTKSLRTSRGLWIMIK
jgi:PAS domain-containing protein